MFYYFLSYIFSCWSDEFYDLEFGDESEDIGINFYDLFL
nr:MAG TPA: hypothetical protein [Bacteriophage sp.]